MTSDVFPTVFYWAAVFAAIAAVACVFVRSRTYGYAAFAALVGPLILVYLMGMYRVGGVDFSNYESFVQDRNLVPDVGYKLLMELVSELGIGLDQFFLVQGIFSFVAVLLLARKFKADLVVVITLYVLHAAIVRDFSQSRVALALAFYFLALAQRNRVSYVVLTLVGVSMHLSIVPLIAAYHWSHFAIRAQHARSLLIIAPAVGLVVGVGLLLPVLAAIDPRVGIYMNWKADLYGNPVSSYSSLLLLLLISVICYRAWQVTRDKETLAVLVMILYATAVFIAFRDLSIFATRLANVVSALYPFAVGRAIVLLKDVRSYRLEMASVTAGLLLVCLLAITFRSGSIDVLRDTEPALLVQSCGGCAPQ